MSDLRLKRCDAAKCESMCCYDGVWLQVEEDQRLTALVTEIPALASHHPCIVDAPDGGRKTSTRQHEYKNADYPAHFAGTRCVFADASGLCQLETLARTREVHPWTYKPKACWMFPLTLRNGSLVSPPIKVEDDPCRSPGYPGFVTSVSCGKHTPDGEAWKDVLADEINYYEQHRSNTSAEHKTVYPPAQFNGTARFIPIRKIPKN
jgi:hypothetical protein